MTTEKTENTNCLANMKCPECSALEPFNISVLTTVTMSDNGSEMLEQTSGDLEWEDDSPCKCLVCGFFGKVRDFKTTQTMRPQDEETSLRQDEEEVSLRQDSSNEYTLLAQSAWITAKKMSVYVHTTDEGLCVDIYRLGDEAGGNPMGSTYVFDSEAEKEE